MREWYYLYFADGKLRHREIKVKVFCIVLNIQSEPLNYHYFRIPSVIWLKCIINIVLIQCLSH